MFKKRLFVVLPLSIAYLSALVALMMSASVLRQTRVPDCETTNGSITQFGVFPYIPPIRDRRWINVSYSYCVASNVYDCNLFFGQVSTSRTQYYENLYAPTGKCINVSYSPSNVSNSFVGNCATYVGSAMILEALFGIGVFVAICFAYAVYFSCIKRNEMQTI